ncbi:Acetate non-utilizing protein 9, mitochondrial [Wickerhamomyces ciferrii]|uniref:Succinate dehydrogenase assembly factor 3 n=1 Tax=Wickerhamomyces ciferrii (strain ATCC 14091 / BCRC 22168 / CBS 111 / JCM 3599 / NBRC 0793 / NRRL Y-1031 F-60-10) TaxID=1206466 RepID=K0KMF1_WICCF|nr:Acetate non-utilizing protein 9, mitochondrial [Wickerhamomyces ciferrii]CCH46455.1 Acetate non-utilizing protein 9, mitochondrial [Wickerhamomyces ciferrii]
MKQSLITLAKAVRPRRPERPNQVLLPPVTLYRKILRAHKLLPKEQRELGDLYVKDEFKAHKSTDNPLYIVGFLTSWQEYLQLITNGKWKESSLTNEQLTKMSPDQVNQVSIIKT